MGKELPKGWIEVQIKDIAVTQSGGTPSTKRKDYWGGDVPWINSGKLKDKIINKPSKFITSLGLKESSAKLFPENSVVIALTGATTGKVGFLNLETSTNQSVTGILPNEFYSGKLLFYQLQHLRPNILSNALGSAQPHINKRIVDETIINLPPLPEQKRIVIKLDRLFGHLDQLKARLESIPQLLKNFRQSVLTQAVTGKLTEEWREGKELEDISITFKRIDERRSKHKKKKVRETKINLRHDLELFEIPNNWKWCDLNYLLNEEGVFRYGVLQPGQDIENEQKLIRVKDLYNGKILKNQLRGISTSIDEKYKTGRVKKGELLVSVVGTIGRTAIVDKGCEGFNIARAIAKIPIVDFKIEYIKCFLDTSICQTWLNSEAREVARKTLNLEQLKSIPIPLAPILEQKEIVKRVESLFAKADAIEEKYKNLKEKIDQLPQAILAKAFKGELVEQLPTDGDAMELLEEIRELKESSKSKKE